MRRPLPPQHKQIFQSSRAKTIDPRFQDYAGTYNPEMAMKAYSFIPKVQQNEAQELKNKIKKGRMSPKDK